MDQIVSTLLQILTNVLIFVLSLGVGVILAIIAYKVIDKLTFKSNLEKRLKRHDKTFLLVKTSSKNEDKENSMEEFLVSLHRVIPNNTELALEMASSNQFLHFYIVIPKALKGLVESQLYAQFPEAEVEEVSDYLPQFTIHTAFSQLYFKKPSVYPVNTYHNMDEDLLKNLSAILAKTEANEQAVVQIALKRVGGKFWERGMPALWFNLFGRKTASDGSPTQAFAKMSQDLYKGKIRVVYHAENKTTAESKLSVLVSLFKSVKGEYNEFKKKKVDLFRYLSREVKARMFDNGDYFSPAELATLYHFPYKGNIVSNIVNTTSKRAPAPDILPREGTVDPKEVSFIGETNYRNDHVKFGIKRFDRRRHLYVVGKTGSGKSKLLEMLLVSDIQSGQGCCLIDPHGDLAEEVLKFVPKERIEDVVYVNPADRDFPIGFNPLEPIEDYEVRQHLARFFIAIFKKMFAGTWNDRMEHLIRYITLALLETPDSNVLGIPRMLSDTSFRQRVIKQIQDPVVKSFWTNEFSASNEQFISAAAVPILNKVGQFISNPIIRNMVGQRKNMLDFDNFMNTGKIVIINISKGKLGDENTALLGSMFITKIQQAALARSKMAEEERKDFYFYVDEFQNFATEAFSSILSEARKYRLDLTIAHQYIAQLPEDVKATAFGNVGSIITFAIGGDDAAYLTKEFAPVFSADDMINLNTREMYIKMSVDGRLTTPFSAKTLNVPKSEHDYSDQIKNKSQLKFGRNKVTVENEIKKWSSAVESGAPVSDESFPEPII